MNKHEVKNEYQYKAFISYSHKDDKFSAWLLKALENYRLPGRVRKSIAAPSRLGRIFRDRDELPATGHMTDRIFEALEKSEFLIVVCSPASARSKLVNREIAEFKRIRGDSNILCVIIDGVPFAEDPAQECFPEALKLKFTKEGKQNGFAAEGLAADAREEGDGEQQALMKLIAGMLNVGLNDLVRRENQRRQQKLMIFSVAASVGIAVMGGLTYEAHHARIEAEAALKLAEAKERETETHLENNEKLMRLLMATIYEDLLAAGSLTSLENLSETLLTFLEKRKFSRNRDRQTAVIIPTNLRLGQALERRGETERAADIFQKTRVIAEELYLSRPDLRDALGKFQNTLFFTGYLALRRGNYEKAAAEYNYRVKVVEEYLKLPFAPDKLKPRHLQLVHHKKMMADALGPLGFLKAGPLAQPDEALELGQKSIALWLEVLASDPESVTERTRVANSLHFLANTHMALGQHENALARLQHSLALFDSVLEDAPASFRIKYRRAITLQQITRLEGFMGAPSTHPLETLGHIVRDFDSLTEKDPANMMWLAASAAAYHDYAAALLSSGDLTAAASAKQTANQQITKALAVDSSFVGHRLTAHKLRLLAARLSAARGDITGAMASTTEAVTALEAEGHNYLRAHDVLDYAGELYLFHGDQLTAAGLYAEAQASWQKLAELNETTLATKTPAFLKALDTSMARIEAPYEIAR